MKKRKQWVFVSFCLSAVMCATNACGGNGENKADAATDIDTDTDTDADTDGDSGPDSGNEQLKPATHFVFPQEYPSADDFCTKYLPTVPDEEATKWYTKSYPLTGNVPTGWARGCIVGNSAFEQLARDLPWDGKYFSTDGTLNNVSIWDGEPVKFIPGKWHIGQSWFNRQETSIVVEYEQDEKWDAIYQQETGGLLGHYTAYRDEIREVVDMPGFFIGKMYLRPSTFPNTSPEPLFTIHFALIQGDFGEPREGNPDA